VRHRILAIVAILVTATACAGPSVKKADALAMLISPIHDLAHRLRWSHWRRRHQASARNYHYRRQAATQP
jgi:hypothetical protein